ncbi:MAG: cytochrome c oxidase subunit II [Myxococcales bacterium]|nr:cytochrome c oxidase subunit II [Myxococcales bacterium]
MSYMQTLLAGAAKRTFWMPETAATQAENVDGIFYFIYWLCVFFFVLIVGVMIYFVIKYRRRGAHDRTSDIEGNTRLEIAWSVIPSVLLLVMFMWGFRDWMSLNVAPEGAIDVRVTAQRWQWNYALPRHGCDGVDELRVPINEPVKLTMSSIDVLHSFYVPAFRVKKDALPNRYTVLWFNATKLGTFDVFCTEYCGTKHSTMYSKIKVVTRAEYDKWTKSGCGMDNLSPKELGPKIFKMRGCPACHSIKKGVKGTGPWLAGKYGTIETLADGSKVKIDDEYIRESIMNPNAKVVKGFGPVMPTFKGRITPKQMNALIDYIKSLK